MAGTRRKKQNPARKRSEGEEKKTASYLTGTAIQCSAISHGNLCGKRYTGFVNLGTAHDTVAFEAESICRWLMHIGT